MDECHWCGSIVDDGIIHRPHMTMDDVYLEGELFWEVSRYFPARRTCMPCYESMERQEYVWEFFDFEPFQISLELEDD